MKANESVNVANEGVNMVEETKKFQEALGEFYAWNPKKPYDFLLLFYFAKERKLFYRQNSLEDEIHDFKFGFREIEDVESRKVLSGVWLNVLKMAGDHPKVAELVEDIKSGGQHDKFCFNETIFADAPEGLQEKLSRISCRWPSFEDDDERNDTDFDTIKEVSLALIGLSDKWYAENVDWAFIQILKAARESAKGKRKPFWLPQGTEKLMCALLGTASGSVNVTSEYTGDFALNLCGEVDYHASASFGEDYWAVSQLHLLLHGRNVEGLNDPIDDLRSFIGLSHVPEQVYDNIINVTIGDYIGYTQPNPDNYDTESWDKYNIIERNATMATMKCVGLYGEGVCFQRSVKKPSWHKIVDEDWLETVILLPDGIFENTSIATVIFVTNKNKQQKGLVKLVDASYCYTSPSKRHKCLNVEDILVLANSDNVYTTMVSNGEIISNNYVVYPPYYIHREVVCKDGMHLLTLGDCLKILPAAQSNKETGLLFSFDRRSTHAAEYLVKASELELQPLDEFQCLEVNEDCLLWTKSRKQFAYLQTEDKVVNVHPSFKAFKVDTSLVNPQYLLAELYKDYFLNQMDRFARGFIGHGRFMRVEDFLSLKICVPETLLVQNQMVAQEASAYFEKQTAAMVSQYKERMESFVLGQRQRKHAVAQVLNEILPALENVKDFIENNKSVTKDSVVSQRSGKTLEEYFNSLLSQMNKVIGMVDSFTDSEDYGPVEEFDIYAFLIDYVQNKNTSDRFEVYMNPLPEHMDEWIDFSEGEASTMPPYIVKGSRKAIAQMLDNLIANAKEHGFVDRDHTWYSVGIELEHAEDHGPGMVCISVFNNGELVSDSIDLDKLFTWGIGHGSGIGCSQVKQIAEHYGGTVTYEENEKSPYPCIFNIYLPLIID